MMKRYVFKLFVKKDNSLLMTIECYNKELKKGLEKQLKKQSIFIDIKESEIDV